MAPSVKHWLLAASVAGIVMLTNLGGPRLWDRDEPRNAGCAREMLAAGDWIVPKFNAQLRTHKPALLYWCIMASYTVLGVGEFSARLPSALFAIGSTLATYALARRLFSPQAALWSAIALATSLMFGVAGRAATPDSALIFFATLATAVYVMGTFQRRGDQEDVNSAPRLKTPGHFFPQQWAWVALLYGVMGLAVLAKGPVGLVLPTAVIGMFLLIMRLPARAEASAERKVERAESSTTSEAAGTKFGDEPSEEVFAIWLRRAAVLLRPFAPRHFLATCW